MDGCGCRLTTTYFDINAADQTGQELSTSDSSLAYALRLDSPACLFLTLPTTIDSIPFSFSSNLHFQTGAWVMVGCGKWVALDMDEVGCHG